MSSIQTSNPLLQSGEIPKCQESTLVHSQEDEILCSMKNSAECDCIICKSHSVKQSDNFAIKIPGCSSDTGTTKRPLGLPTQIIDNETNESKIDREVLTAAKADHSEDYGPKHQEKPVGAIYKLSFRNGLPHSKEALSSFYNAGDAESSGDKKDMHPEKSKGGPSTEMFPKREGDAETKIRDYPLANCRILNVNSLLKESKSADATFTSLLNNKGNHKQLKQHGINSEIFSPTRFILERNQPPVLLKSSKSLIGNKPSRSERQIASIKPLRPVDPKPLIEKKNVAQRVENQLVLNNLRSITENPRIQEQLSVTRNDSDYQGVPYVKTPNVNVGYTEKATVVQSESFTEDVATIVDNVLKANLPVLLLAGVVGNTNDKKDSCQDKVGNTLNKFEENKSEVNSVKSDVISDGEVSSESFEDFRQMRVSIEVKESSSGKVKDSEGHAEEKQDEIAINGTQREETEHESGQSLLKSDGEISEFMSLVKCMINRLPSQVVLCKSGASKDKYIRYVLSSDVIEVLFPRCNLLPSLMTVKSLPASSLILCSPQAKRKFGEMCLRVNAGQYMIAVDAFSNKEWCKKLLRLNKEVHQGRKSQDESPKEKPLLGEVHHGSRSLPMVYRFSKFSRKALIYVPATDLVKAFPHSSVVLKNLDVMIANDELKFVLRNRNATQEEARCLMRYKSATGALHTEDDTWKYLTSRSILVCWEDFKRAFCAKSSSQTLSIGRLKNEGNQEENLLLDTPLKKGTKKHQISGMSLMASSLKKVPPLTKQKSFTYEKAKLKKRKRSCSKLEQFKKRHRSPKMRRSPSPKPQRTSTPVTEISKEETLEMNKITSASNQGPGSSETYTQIQKQSEEQSIDKKVKHNKKCRGLWKMQQDVLQEGYKKHLPEGLPQRRGNKLQPITETNVKGPSKNVNAGSMVAKRRSPVKESTENNDPKEIHCLEKALSDAVSENPFNQSLNSLKMVKKLDEELQLAENRSNTPPCVPTRVEKTIDRQPPKPVRKVNSENDKYAHKGQVSLPEQTKMYSSFDVKPEDKISTAKDEKLVDNSGSGDSPEKVSELQHSEESVSQSRVSPNESRLQANRPKVHSRELASLQPVHSAFSPLKVKFKSKSRPNLLKVREPVKSETNMHLEEVKLDTDSEKPLKCESNKNRETVLEPERNLDKYNLRDSNRTKKKRGRKSKTKGTKTSKGMTRSDEIPEKWSSASPHVMMENQRIIMRIIKSKTDSQSETDNPNRREKQGDTPNNVPVDSRLQKSNSYTKEERSTRKQNLRIFPRLSTKDAPSNSGMVVIDNEGVPHSLPYVLNNGYPYIDLRSVPSLFPNCQCSIVGKVLRMSKHLARNKLMCSYEEAKLLNEEGRQFGMKPISSGSWLMRIDKIVDHLTNINQEIEESHQELGERTCYYRQSVQ